MDVKNTLRFYGDYKLFESIKVNIYGTRMAAYLEITMKRVEMKKKSIIRCDKIFTKIQRVSASEKAINPSAQKLH